MSCGNCSGVRLDVVYSAPCEPARSTAIAICNECGAAFKELADFCNVNHGLWQGLQLDDARRKYPKVFKQWQESPETVCLPEGETVAEALERIERGLRKCLKRKRNVGIVASEPLATLIGCVLRGCRPELPDAAAYCQPERRIEFLHLSEDDVAGRRSVIASASAIGIDTDRPAPTNRHAGTNAKRSKAKQRFVRAAKQGQRRERRHRQQWARQPTQRSAGPGGAPADSAEMPTTAPRRAPE